MAKANSTLGCIRNSVASWSREVTSFVLLTPPLECYIQCWAPPHKEDVDLLEQVQRRALEMLKGVKHLSYKERLSVFQ